MVLDHEREYDSQWATIRSIAEKIGCTAETLRKWVRQAERNSGRRPGLTTEKRERRRGTQSFQISASASRVSGGLGTRERAGKPTCGSPSLPA